MAKMTKKYRDQFLSKTRYGILTTLNSDGSPISVPIWFDWDGFAIRIFTGKDSAKVKRIQRDARLTVLVTNHLDENEAWVAFDGNATIQSEGGIELAERLAEKYWDLSDPDRKATLNSWRRDAQNLCVIELVPTRIRTLVD